MILFVDTLVSGRRSDESDVADRVCLTETDIRSVSSQSVLRVLWNPTNSGRDTGVL